MAPVNDALPATPVIVVVDAVCDGLTVHEDPLPAVMTVPAVIPVPVRTWPIEMIPLVTELTPKVVPEIDPVNTAVPDVIGAGRGVPRELIEEIV
jgi:hypothetical protein